MNETTMVETIPKRGFISLAGGILIRPRATFAYLRERGGRAWLLAAILLLALSSLPPLVSGPIHAQEARERIIQQFESQPAFGGGEVDIDQVASFAASPLVTTVIPTIGAVFGLFFSWLLWGGALYLLAAMTGGRGGFGQTLQIVVWASVPYGLRYLLQTSYIGLTGALIETPGLSGFAQQPQPEGMAFAPPRIELQLLSRLLEQAEIYLFWYLALLVMGLIVMAQLPQRKAVWLVVAVWAVFLLLRLLEVVITGSLTGGFMG